MKKNLVFTYFIAMIAIIMMTGCGNSEKEEMIQSRNYRKACELKDFITAYEIVDELKERTAFKKKWRDAYHTSGSDTEYEESKKYNRIMLVVSIVSAVLAIVSLIVAIVK